MPSEPDAESKRVPSPSAEAMAPDRWATDALFAQIYDQLRRVAQERLSAERRDHTLQATALVHEAYLRLMGDGSAGWANRGHFFIAASEAMRRILIEHARSRATQRRGGDGKHAPAKVPVGVLDLALEQDPEQILALDDAIARLEREDPQVGQVVRLRFYAGLSIDETAEALAMSPRSVDRDWAYARAKLHLYLRAPSE